MGVLIGKLIDKEILPSSIHIKSKLTISSDKEIAFIEFRGDLKKISDEYSIYDKIMVEYFCEGKVLKKYSNQ